MNIWLKVSLGLLVWGSALGSGCSQSVTSQPATVAAAIQAIQQAGDPSAAVAAYGSGLALTANDPKLHEAYVVRMVDMGLPEMAYHQAQTLTTLQPNNGLAWGVVAYVDARRGQMPEAVSAIKIGSASCRASDWSSDVCSSDLITRPKRSLPFSPTTVWLGAWWLMWMPAAVKCPKRFPPSILDRKSTRLNS